MSSAKDAIAQAVDRLAESWRSFQADPRQFPSWLPGSQGLRWLSDSWQAGLQGRAGRGRGRPRLRAHRDGDGPRWILCEYDALPGNRHACGTM